MKLIYGRSILTTLNIHDASAYGFDTMQLRNMFSNSKLSDVSDDLRAPDEYFSPDMDFVLSLNLIGEPQCGSNSSSKARGSIDRDPWYDNPSHAFYNGWDALIEDVEDRYGSPLQGIALETMNYRPASSRGQQVGRSMPKTMPPRTTGTCRQPSVRMAVLAG